MRRSGKHSSPGALGFPTFQHKASCATDGLAVKELVEASQEADVVVLGARGGSGLARLLVGSASTEVVQHSPCPVVIVPYKR